jgi:hypothetical protein
MEFKIGDIYFYKNTDNLFGKAIDLYNKKVFKKSDATHVGIIADVSNTQVLIFESMPQGFVQSWYDKSWLEAVLLEDTVHMGRVNGKMTDVLKNCKVYENIGYGWLDIVTIGIFYITGLRLSLTKKNKIICSEAVNYVIYDSTKSINFAAEYGISPDQVTPQHIFLSKQITILI